MRRNYLKFYLSAALLILFASEAYSQAGTTDIFSPKFSYLSGRYSSDIQVQLTTNTPDASIYYTLDGTEPDNTSQLYSGTIPINGNGNYKTIKAVTISQDSQRSLTSSATYIIDYSFNPNAAYLTDLSWANYTDYIAGDWFGHTSTPWTDDYCVNVSILPNGNYVDSATSASCSTCLTDVYLPAFYYGITAPSPLKTIALNTILSSGYADGFITIDFGSGSTNEDELRYIKFLDDKNLYLEMWHHTTYGPLKYYLTKKDSEMTAGIDEHQHTNMLIYPNPASEFVIIKDLDSDVQFLNQLGQSFIIEKSETIAISGLPKGFYVVSYQNTQGDHVKQKLIVE